MRKLCARQASTSRAWPVAPTQLLLFINLIMSTVPITQNSVNAGKNLSPSYIKVFNASNNSLPESTWRWMTALSSDVNRRISACNKLSRKNCLLSGTYWPRQPKTCSLLKPFGARLCVFLSGMSGFWVNAPTAGCYS